MEAGVRIIESMAITQVISDDVNVFTPDVLSVTVAVIVNVPDDTPTTVPLVGLT
jgi:hypothetical protein